MYRCFFSTAIISVGKPRPRFSIDLNPQKCVGIHRSKLPKNSDGHIFSCSLQLLLNLVKQHPPPKKINPTSEPTLKVYNI